MTSTWKGITSVIVAALFAAIVIGSFSVAHAATLSSRPSSVFAAFFGFGWGSQSSASVTYSGSVQINSVGVRISY